MGKVNEIKIPKGVRRIAVKQHDDKIVIEFIPEEPKNGDWVIAWNNNMILAVIGIKIDANPAQACKHVLNNNNSYKHAIKFESKEQFEKILRGEI